jgi:hypothetical protein
LFAGDFLLNSSGTSINGTDERAAKGFLTLLLDDQTLKEIILPNFQRTLNNWANQKAAQGSGMFAGIFLIYFVY